MPQTQTAERPAVATRGAPGLQVGGEVLCASLIALADARPTSPEAVAAELAAHPLASKAGALAAEPLLVSIATALARDGVTIQVHSDPALRLAPGTLLAVGVIACEAVTNALRHAFPAGRPGRIWLKLATEGANLMLTVRDNGLGIPDPDTDHEEGRRLIEGLASRLGGRSRLGSAPFGGGLVTVAFPG